MNSDEKENILHVNQNVFNCAIEELRLNREKNKIATYSPYLDSLGDFDAKLSNKHYSYNKKDLNSNSKNESKLKQIFSSPSNFEYSNKKENGELLQDNHYLNDNINKSCNNNVLRKRRISNFEINESKVKNHLYDELYLFIKFI